MRVLGFCALHYGREYLEATLRAVEPFVDKFLIAYTPRPSYSHQGGLQCPETQQELIDIADQVLGNKLIWVNGLYNSEGEHRSVVYRYWGMYDLVFSVDADEVWNPDFVYPALAEAYDNPCTHVGLGGDCWRHFWRSFNECNRDGFYPIRFQKKGGRAFNAEEGIIHSGLIYHMGYAQSESLMKYKMSCHGHKNEIAGTWLRDKWLNYTKGETTMLHPASQDIWNETQPFDKTKMPDILKEHDYYNLEKII